MSFAEIQDRAEKKAGSQNKLGVLLGGSHNLARQWRLGQGLPSTPEKIAKLAELAGVSVTEVEEAVWAERRNRWEQTRRPARDSSLSPTRKPPVPVHHPLVRTRQYAMAGAR
jgi:transcriptional regulator with XRE-family HTH domain